MKKKVFFFPISGGRNFAPVNVAKTIAYLTVIFPLLLTEFFFFFVLLKVLSCQAGDSVC